MIEPRKVTGSFLEIFLAFLRLGCSAFGGPVAHLGHFHQDLVKRRGWLTEQAYADLVALCQFLPGPASSQTGFGIGLLRGGWKGGLAAWTAFTAPSALLMILAAYGEEWLTGGAHGDGVLRGLKLAAVSVVAHAAWGLARKFCRGWITASLAAASLGTLLAWPISWTPPLLILCGAAVGSRFLEEKHGSSPEEPQVAEFQAPAGRGGGMACLILFLVLLVFLPLMARQTGWAGLDGYYRSGALVFGGGHVVLPLLEAEVVETGLVSEDAFLAGYGAAQALPGPLFTFGAYLGTVQNEPPHGWPGGLIALVALFLPGLLLLAGLFPHWDRLRCRPGARGALCGANAIVVGLLGAALIHPVASNGVTTPGDGILALVGIGALARQCPPWLLVGVCGAIGVWLPG